ncbi:alpha/beta fold hydrolase [Amycolatopsis australiensis]|uniref:Pimeloyl-ACP methyl ester carboxylesterase n=1 Tax=Amycolatopsis australiensis TaxID=546364 RepID=A0A1K1RJF8_9PSEU|nr:alpha/beta hydrolase [Amycolatopsis australiensis]SFW71980.1 Pimeloyl-ACP methyl ester carboxylesterase [Amycolatopsis australiensis]
MTVSGFEYRRIAAGDVRLGVAVGGEGPPVVLLHGFPQTHLAWRHVAAALARDHRVICPDLRGYGGSDKPPGDYAKRRMAADVVALARALGHDRFALAGHDRGALVAFRAALDHPEAVTHLAVLDVIPAVDLWASLTGTAGVFAFHLFLLAYPPPLPERLLGAAPAEFFGHFLDVWTRDPAAIPPRVRAGYLAAASTPESIAAICADYRASATVDAEHDAADRAAGRRLAMPVAALWQRPAPGVELPFDPAAVWASWAPDLRTHVLDCGHFLPEEQPDAVVAALRELMAADASTGTPRSPAGRGTPPSSPAPPSAEAPRAAVDSQHECTTL